MCKPEEDAKVSMDTDGAFMGGWGVTRKEIETQTEEEKTVHTVKSSV